MAKRKTPGIFPVFTPFLTFGPNFENWGKNWENFWERTYDKAKGHYEMRKLHYKGRCTKKTLSKCKDICRTYDKIQTAFADWLQENEEIVSFQCNVKIEIGVKDPYTTDFYAEKKDGTVLVRECVWRKNLSRPTTCRLLDLSRNYWLSHGVEDWGIMIIMIGAFCTGILFLIFLTCRWCIRRLKGRISLWHILVVLSCSIMMTIFL